MVGGRLPAFESSTQDLDGFSRACEHRHAPRHFHGPGRRQAKPMRTLLTGGVLATLAFALAACGGSNGSSASERTLERNADSDAISQIERSFHGAISKKDINEMVGLFARHATGTFGPGKTVTGKEQIRRAWLKSVAFKPQT